MEKWTVMVYMAGDNNLSEDMVTALTEMEKTIQSEVGETIKFFAFYDTQALGFPSLKCDFSNGERVYSQTKSEVYKISDFVKWCLETGKNESDNYALILSGHSDGFLQNSFLRDTTSNDYIKVYQLRRELNKIKDELLEGKKLSIIGFESCAMSSLETAYEMSSFADIMVASQGYVPNAGWNYGRIIKKLNSEFIQNKKDLTKEDLANVFVESQIESNWNYAQFSGRSIDASWCDLSKITDVGKQVYEFGNCLTESLVNNSTGKKTEQAILLAHSKCQTYLYDQCVDIIDFCECLKEYCDETLKDISEHSDKVITAVRDCVMKNPLSIGPSFQYSNGLSLFFPWSYLSYLHLTKDYYISLDFAIGERVIQQERTNVLSGWTNFLENYLFQTMREANNNTQESDKTFLIDLYGSSIDKQSKKFLQQIPTYQTLIETTYRVDPPDARVDPPDGPRGFGVIPEGFKHTKNFPWTPRMWKPSAQVEKLTKKADLTAAKTMKVK